MDVYKKAHFRRNVYKFEISGTNQRCVYTIDPNEYTQPQHHKDTNQPRCVYTLIRLGIPVLPMGIHIIPNKYTQPTPRNRYTQWHVYTQQGQWV